MFLRGLRKAHFSCSNRLIKLTKIVLFTPAEKSKYNYIYKIILNFKLKKIVTFLSTDQKVNFMLCKSSIFSCDVYEIVQNHFISDLAKISCHILRL